MHEALLNTYGVVLLLPRIALERRPKNGFSTYESLIFSILAVCRNLLAASVTAIIQHLTEEWVSCGSISSNFHDL